MKINILSISIVVALASSVCSANSMTNYEKINNLPVIGNFLSTKQESSDVKNSHYVMINKLPVIGGFMNERSIESLGKQLDGARISHYDKISKLPVIGR